MKRFYEFMTSWSVIEVYEIDLPDDASLIDAYVEHCGGDVTWAPGRRDEAFDEMRRDLAREFVHGPGARLVGVDMEQCEDADMHVVERTRVMRDLMHPRVWSLVFGPMRYRDPLEQLCVVMNSTPANDGFEEGDGI